MTNGMWKGSRRVMRGMLLGSLLLVAGLARAEDGGEASTVGLMALLQQTEVNQSQIFGASHAQVCDELRRAGQLLMLIAWDARNRPMHVFYDADQGRYVSVSGSSPTWVRVSTGIPSLRGYTVFAD